MIWNDTHMMNMIIDRYGDLGGDGQWFLLWVVN